MAIIWLWAYRRNSIARMGRMSATRRCNDGRDYMRDDEEVLCEQGCRVASRNLDVFPAHKLAMSTFRVTTFPLQALKVK